MSYTPHEWTNGETVTASKLNHIEEGISNSNGRVLIITENNGILSHTWQEIYDIIDNGGMVFLKTGELTSTYENIWISPVDGFYIDIQNNLYNVKIISNYYQATSPNDYPEISENSIN